MSIYGRKRSPLHLVVAPLVVAALHAAPAAALTDEKFNYTTTADLVTICSVAPEAETYTVASFACRSFIAATFQYHDAVTDRRGLKPLVCPPDGTTVEQARVIFVEWAKKNADNAELMGEMPVKGAVRAMSEKYPCKGASGKR